MKHLPFFSLLLMLLFMIASCEKPYSAEEDTTEENKEEENVPETDTTTAADTVIHTPSSMPQQGTIWNNHIVAYTSGSDALLLSMQEWQSLPSANNAEAPDSATTIAASYTEGDMTSWTIPTKDQARLLCSVWNSDNLESFNQTISSAGGVALTTMNGSKKFRYFCEDATYTFSFASNSTISKAGAKTMYNLRLVKSVRFE